MGRVCACVPAKSLQSRLPLCDPMGCSPPGSSVHGILQAGILEWVARPSLRGSSQPRDQTCISYVSPALAGRFFTTRATWEAHGHGLGKAARKGIDSSGWLLAVGAVILPGLQGLVRLAVPGGLPGKGVNFSRRKQQVS